MMLSTFRLASMDINMESIRNALNTCQLRGIEIEHIGACEANNSQTKMKEKKGEKMV